MNPKEGCGRPIGVAGGWLAERATTLARIEGLEHLDQADEILKRGGSLLVIGNHPNAITTAYGYSLVQSLEHRSREASVVLVSSKFFDGRMGIFGDVAMQVAGVSGLEPLKVIQFYDHTQDEERVSTNLNAIQKALKALNSPGGLVWVYPEGTRSQMGLIEGQDGLGKLAERADGIMTIVSPYGDWRLLPQPTVKLLPLIDGKELNRRLNGDLPKASTRQALADTLMTRIAVELPVGYRGFYQPFVEALNNYRPTNPREAYLLHTYKLF